VSTHVSHAVNSVPSAVAILPMTPLRREREDSFFGAVDFVYSQATEETLAKANWIPSPTQGLFRQGFLVRELSLLCWW
jgi:hypothetical protein